MSPRPRPFLENSSTNIDKPAIRRYGQNAQDNTQIKKKRTRLPILQNKQIFNFQKEQKSN